MKLDTDLAIALAASALLHAAALALLPLPGGSAGSGASGADRITVATTPAIMVTLERLDRTPEAATDTPPSVAPAEDVAAEVAPRVDEAPLRATFDAPATPAAEAAAFVPPATPVAPRVPLPPAVAMALPEAPSGTSVAVPEAITAPAPSRLAQAVTIALTLPDALPAAEAPPTQERAPELIMRPKRKPVPEPAEAVTRQTAGGDGLGASEGTARADALPQVSSAARQSAQAAWAAQIQSRIARHQAWPRGARDAGRVRVAMVILSDGRLDKVSVVTSSGAAVLDEAALQAVRSAAPFPPAPKELTERWFRVGQWIAFERR